MGWRTRLRDRVEGFSFRQLAFLHGPPPKAVWLRMGNASTLDIFNVLRDHLGDVTRFAATEDEALLVLPAT